MKIDRLLETTLVLLNRETVTARELAERFEVSPRTIYRDIDVLSAAGVPIFTCKGAHGGICLLENYALNRTLVTQHEKESILLALKTLQATRYPEIEMMLEKLGALFQGNVSNEWVHIEFSPWGSGPNEENKFLDTKRAILERRVIAFDYINAGGIKTRREMEPMQLWFKSLSWYIWGYCRTRQKFRTFRISRLKNLTVTDEKFVRRPLDSPPENDSESALRRAVTMKLKFQPEALYRLYDDYDEDKITKNADGTYGITMVLPEDEWVYGYILSFGSNVEVLEPEHVRGIIRERLQKTIQFYS